MDAEIKHAVVKMAQNRALVRKDSFADENSAVRDILDRVGDKWSFTVLATLAERSRRFGELRRDIVNISQRMLTQTLRDLTRDGLTSRTVKHTTPPTVEYALTPLGRRIMVPLYGLVAWADSHTPEIMASRAAFDAADEGDDE